MTELISALRDLAGPLGLGGLLLYYVRDRRKQQIADELARRTLGPNVEIRGAEGFQASLVAVEKAFDVERAAKDRAIAFLNERIIAKDGEIADLRQQVATLTAQVRQLAAQVHAQQRGGEFDG